MVVRGAVRAPLRRLPPLLPRRGRRMARRLALLLPRAAGIQNQRRQHARPRQLFRRCRLRDRAGAGAGGHRADPPTPLRDLPDAPPSPRGALRARMRPPRPADPPLRLSRTCRLVLRLALRRGGRREAAAGARQGARGNFVGRGHRDDRIRRNRWWVGCRRRRNSFCSAYGAMGAIAFSRVAGKRVSPVLRGLHDAHGAVGVGLREGRRLDKKAGGPR
mmetsp:Transcript_18313/g.37962  ORF Transcript_18313/g.37962 Transcript_18313/m.37962 type:complete len:218 (+) Transcript_18313:741-1394(+)